MIRFLTACLVAAAACTTSAARGAVLFERSLLVDRSVNIFTTDNFNLEFVFGDAFFSPSNPLKLFEGAAINPFTGATLFTLGVNDPGFEALAERLTDAQDQFVRLIVKETASGRSEQRGWQESNFFLGHGSNLVPDLAGATVDGVQLRIDEFQLLHASPLALLPAGPQVKLLMTFTVTGVAVPEPATWALAAIGLAAMGRSVYTGGRRRR